MSAMASQSPASRLFIQSFIQAQIKENIKAARRWPVTRKMFPFYDDIMPSKIRKIQPVKSITYRYFVTT